MDCTVLATAPTTALVAVDAAEATTEPAFFSQPHTRPLGSDIVTGLLLE